MMSLGIGAALLVSAALVFIWLPWWQRRKLGQGLSQKQLNIAAFRTRLAELETDYQAGAVAEADYAALKADLENRLLLEAEEDNAPTGHTQASPALVIGLTLLVTAAGSGLYQYLGAADQVLLTEQRRVFAEQLVQAAPAERVTMLEQAVAEDPTAAEYWYFLARFYMQGQQHTKAQQAYARALALRPGDPTLGAEFAQALFFIQGNRITDPVRAVMEQVLAVDPGNVSILGMQGIDAFEQGDYTTAIARWQQVLASGVSGQAAASIQSGIEQAKQRLAAAGSEAEVAAAAVTVTVDLAETLKQQAQPGQRVFIYAKAMAGPPMPLAVITKEVKDLPVTVTLDDSLAMMPAMKLSGFEQVELLARVSASGSANTQAGDLLGRVPDINPKQNQKTIKILIDQVVE